MCYVAVPSVGVSRATDPDGDAGSDLGGWDEYDPALTPDAAMGRLNDEFEAALGGRSAIRNSMVRSDLHLRSASTAKKPKTYVADAFRAGFELEEIYGYSGIDPWFLVQIEDLIKEEQRLLGAELSNIDTTALFKLKRKGFSDKRLGDILGCGEQAVREHRHQLDIHPVYKRVDTCAAEFSTDTAYMYSTYEEECEAQPSNRDKILVLGGGPNRIGQGIEFDYCCVHAALAMRDDGYETIMVNCNPETVSTDYDTSDRLFFEPVTLEDVLEIVRLEKPKGVIVQFGGQTPLKLARALEAEGVPIVGTTPDAIDRAEDRERFQHMIQKLDLLQPSNATARSAEDAVVYMPFVVCHQAAPSLQLAPIIHTHQLVPSS